MFELKMNIAGFRPSLSANLISKETERLKVDVFIDTIKSLKQKILQLEQQLIQAKYFGSHDVLTGLANRSLLQDRLAQAINQATRHGKEVGLLLLDLNDFKKINDNYGHNIGDALLVQTAERIIDCIRASDSAYRYGGDEFVILLPAVKGTAGMNKLVSKLYTNLAKPYSLAGQNVVVTTSIGMAVYPTDGLTQDDLIREADTKMYQAKNDKHSSK